MGALLEQWLISMIHMVTNDNGEITFLYFLFLEQKYTSTSIQLNLLNIVHMLWGI